MSAPLRQFSKGVLRVLQHTVHRTNTALAARPPPLIYHGTQSPACGPHSKAYSGLSGPIQGPSPGLQSMMGMMNKLTLLGTPVTSVIPKRTKRHTTKVQEYDFQPEGTPKSAQEVFDRYYRLRWGVWIRTRAGRHRHMWKKSASRKYRLRQHVFCTKAQCQLFDKLTRSWKKDKIYAEDPYHSYHQRTNFHPLSRPKTKPFLP